MVSATATPKLNAARKLKKAANSTAFRGESTFVDTTVEIELAESWKPFVKSKMSAMKMIATIRISGAAIMGALHYTIVSTASPHECRMAISESMFATSSQ